MAESSVRRRLAAPILALPLLPTALGAAPAYAGGIHAGYGSDPPPCQDVCPGASDVVGAEAHAHLTQAPGEYNYLAITVTQTLADGTQRTVTEMHRIRNKPTEGESSSAGLLDAQSPQVNSGRPTTR